MESCPPRAPIVPRPVHWVGSSKEDLSAFPEDVKNRLGGALWDAQIGLTAAVAKALKGFGSADVREIVDDFGGNTYRAVYTVQFPEAVFVLHVFQKKSTRGIRTSRRDLDLIDRRLKRAATEYQQWRKHVVRRLP